MPTVPAAVREALRTETVGGGLLVAGALVALLWANSPWADSYTAVRELRVGPSALHLDLTLGTWAADGLLAIFFFVAGLELKRELVAGELRDPRRAVVPVAAACGGVLVPAGLYALVNLRDGGQLAGWAIPTATDIAFALAVLALVGPRLPTALRAFLLTLAVVDDLIAITIIAVAYTQDLDLRALLLAVLPLAAFAVLVQRGVRAWWLLLPLACVTWALVHASGVHATVAGVLLAFTVPVGLAERYEHRIRPLSAGVAVPVFALLSAGVALGGLRGLERAVSDPVALGIVLGLVVGKPLGVLGTTWLVSRFIPLDSDLAWRDLVGLAALSGVGFTVSLLIGELAFGAGSERDGHVKVAVLLGSLLAAGLAALLLRPRNRAYSG
ncbi:MAG: Na+/H+ antiporter NhaA [Frankiales bacterium]|nr:Na+/H+ antiporter NhaA [Frankiales bacterium]